MPVFSLDWCPILQKVQKTIMWCRITQWEQCCLHSGILILLVLPWNSIVQIDSKHNVVMISLPMSGIIRNMSWLPKLHMAYTQRIQFLRVCLWGNQLFAHSIPYESNMFMWSLWMKLLLTLCTLSISTQSAIQCGNTLSAMSICFVSLMKCIRCL